LAEFKLNNLVCIISGLLIGIILQIIGNEYQSDSNNSNILQAVLNTHFWLIIHVLTISIGYSFCFIISVLSYFYFFFKINDVKNIYFLHKFVKNTLLLIILSIFICSIGTILGGMWADQSWGRFWGWDPKENGALLIILWLLLLLHVFISGFLSNYFFLLSLLFTKIIVLLAWFGVNILDTGFHSYGLIQNFKESVLLFFFLDFFFISFIFLILLYKNIYIKITKYV